MESQKSKDARRIAAAMEAVEVRLVSDKALSTAIESAAVDRSASAVDRLLAKLGRKRGARGQASNQLCIPRKRGQR